MMRHPPDVEARRPRPSICLHHDSSSSRLQEYAWAGVGPIPAAPGRALAAKRNERRYRLLLQHGFNPSRESVCVLLLSSPPPRRL